MAEKYPVCNGGKHFGVAVHEVEVAEGKIYNMRGNHILGDDNDVASFWDKISRKAEDLSHRTLTIFDAERLAFLWSAMVPGTVYVPYLDFDEKLIDEDHFQTLLSERIMPSIDLIQKAISKAAQTEARWQMFFNARALGDGLMKFSFHVHFYDIGIENINMFKMLLSNMADLPRKLNWVQKNGLWVFEEDLKPIVDTGVYGGRKQLFRGPFCGKGGCDFADLKPMKVLHENGKLVLEEDAREPRVEYILRSRIARDRLGLKMADFVDNLPPHLLSRSSAPTLPSASFVGGDDENRRLYAFFRPLILNKILPTWQQFRKGHLDSQTIGQGAAVPISGLRILKDEPHNSKVGIRHLVVEGDTYCMMDTNHYHRSNPKTIGLSIDLIHCTIQQSCFACAKYGAFYRFLHINNEIRIEEKERSAFSCLEHFEAPKDPRQFLLDYYPDLFRYHKITQKVWIYDEAIRTWKTDALGNRVAGVLIEKLNSVFNSYLNVKKFIVLKRTVFVYQSQNPGISPDTLAEFVDKLNGEAREFMTKNSDIARFPVASRQKLLDELKQYTVHEEILDFNPYLFLVPMKNFHCLNVFTLETEEIRPNHYFTTTLNAELVTPCSDIEDVEKWFLEIATGDTSKCEYLKLIAGYMMTMSVHDRKMYVLKGTGKNGKGIFKQFILDILEGAEGAEPRWKSLQPRFWTKKSTSENPESAAPETLLMLHKSVIYTDDMDRVQVDSGLAKRIVAGEPQTCRGLYGNPIQFRPTAKVLWTTNFVPDGPGNDCAYWERFIMILFLTKYTMYPKMVNPDRYIFLMNDVKVKQLLLKRDAFFTIVMKTLYQYYSSLPQDPETREPSCFASFPVPRIIEITGNDARETQLPLAAFIREYTEKPSHPLQRVAVDILFTNYMQFLENTNERKLKNETTQTSFIRLLMTAVEIDVSGERVDLHLVKGVPKKDGNSYW